VREIGPDGPLPAPHAVPIRNEPKGHHKCDCCPGGKLNDSSRLFSEDHFARCLYDACRPYHRNEFNPEVSVLIGQPDWEEFVRQLLERGLIELDDRPIFDDPPAELSTGLDICGFQQWLFRKLYADDMRQFEQAAEAMRAAVHSVNISVSHRGLESLTQKELYTYQVLLGEYEHSIAESLRQTLQRIRTGEKEFDQRMLSSSVQAAHTFGVSTGKEYLGSDPGPLPTTPEDFQWSHGPEIERRLREIRVPSVGFPPRERVLSQMQWGLRRLLGFGKDVVGRETEVEVLEIPWDLPEDAARLATYESNRMEALRQLALSKYFVDYLGFDFSSYSGVGLHFLSYKHGIRLRDMVAAAGPVSERQSLFRYWAREILTGMRDYLYQCCHELTEDLTLEHVYVSQEGLQLYFYNVPFGERRGMLYEEIPEYGPRNKWRNGFVAVEARLITMFGNMVLEMFYGEQSHDSPVHALQELSAEMRAMISLAVNARDTLDYLMLGGDSSAEAKAASDVHDLAGGFVAAGIDEFNTGEEYKLWWLRKPKDPILVLPNIERTADERDNGTALTDNWSWSGDIPIHLRTSDDDTLPRMEWKPNARRCDIQGLLNHPALQWTGEGVPISGIMDAWETYYMRYVESRT
jgi:hypothetical protein